MRSSHPSQESHLEGHDEGSMDAGTDYMPVERMTSFSGALNLSRFVHPSSAAMDPTGPSHPGPIPGPVRKGLPTSEHDEVSNGRPRTRSTTASPMRRTTATTSTTLTTTVPYPVRPPTARSKSSSSSTPPTRNIIPSRKHLSRHGRPASTEEDSLLRDTIPHGLQLLLVGVNPGIMTGETGFAYAHPTNQFWKLLYSSGITKTLHPPRDTYKLPTLYNIGNTNIVARPTRDASMLGKKEMDEGVPILEKKVADKQPEVVCLVGKGIWEAVFRVWHGRSLRKEEFRYGWQDPYLMGRKENPPWPGARVFVATTTSGVSTNMTFAEKEKVWAELGQWVMKNRTGKR